MSKRLVIRLLAVFFVSLSIIGGGQAAAQSVNPSPTATRDCQTNRVRVDFDPYGITGAGWVLENSADGWRVEGGTNPTTGFFSVGPGEGSGEWPDWNFSPDHPYDTIVLTFHGAGGPFPYTINLGTCDEDPGNGGGDPIVNVWDVEVVTLQCTGQIAFTISYPETVQEGQRIYWYANQGEQRLTQGTVDVQNGTANYTGSMEATLLSGDGITITARHEGQFQGTSQTINCPVNDPGDDGKGDGAGDDGSGDGSSDDGTNDDGTGDGSSDDGATDYKSGDGNANAGSGSESSSGSTVSGLPQTGAGTGSGIAATSLLIAATAIASILMGGLVIRKQRA